MFKIVDKPTRRVRVDLEIPGDLGKVTRGHFIVEFRTLKKSEIDAIDLAQLEDAKRLRKQIEADEVDALPDRTGEILRDYAVGWENVADAEGEPLEFTPENLDRLLELPFVREGMARAFRTQILGREAERKNS